MSQHTSTVQPPSTTYAAAIPEQLHSAPVAAHSAVFRGRPVKAMVFDLDGTLYRQGPVRRESLLRLLAHSLREPREALLALRAIRAYRHAQERLRGGADHAADLASQQIQAACQETGLSASAVAGYVARWMEEAPLDLLAPAMRPGTVELLASAMARGVRLGVWSDYPAKRKLEAMGLSQFFDVVVSAQDLDVQRFKPDPRGLAVALSRLGVQHDEAIYFGDRPTVDGIAACRLGVRCFIIGGAAIPPGLACEAISGFGEVAAAATDNSTGTASQLNGNRLPECQLLQEKEQA